MLGALRLFLAIMVVANHLWLPLANQIGAPAVVGFYMISGYLMTLVLDRVYPATVVGTMHFLANRALRIFPIYWLAVLLTLLGVALFPQAFGSIYSLIRWPDSAAMWMSNLFLFNLTDCPVIVVPPAWSLSVEFFFYIAMGIAIARSQVLVHVWLGVSLAVAVYLALTEATFHVRYYPVYAASAFFATGSFIYCHRSWLARLALPGRVVVPLVLLFAAWPLMVTASGYDRHYLGYYGAAGLFIVLFAAVLARPPSGLARNVDRLLGDLAYPVFLFHFFSAGVVNLLTGGRLTPYGLPHFLCCVIITIALSCVAIRYFDPAIERLRSVIRGRPPGDAADDNKGFAEGLAAGATKS